MIRSAALLLLAGLLLSGCRQEDPGARSIHSFRTFLSSTGRVGSATEGLALRRAAAPPVLAAATHAAESAHNAEEGSVALTGRVVGSTGARPDAFEVELTPTGASAGAPPVRVVFSDGAGTFELRPPPGEYRLVARTKTRSSQPLGVRVAPGEETRPIQVVLR